jgi:hypothetical protein
VHHHAAALIAPPKRIGSAFLRHCRSAFSWRVGVNLMGRAQPGLGRTLDASAAGRSNTIVLGTSVDATPSRWPEDLCGGWRLHPVREIILHAMTETAGHAGHLDAVVGGIGVDEVRDRRVEGRGGRCHPIARELVPGMQRGDIKFQPLRKVSWSGAVSPLLTNEGAPHQFIHQIVRSVGMVIARND